LRVTRLADHGIDADLQTVAQGLTPHLLRHLGYQPNAAAPNAVMRGYSAINTDLQAVNSR